MTDWRKLTGNAAPVFVTAACCGLIVQGPFSIMAFMVLVSVLLYRAFTKSLVDS